MAGPYYAIIASGQSASGAFALERADRGFTVFVPSLNQGGEVRVQYTQTSGGTAYHLFQRKDGTGLPWTVHSGAGPAFSYVPPPFAAFGRFTMTQSVTGTNTFEVHV